MLKKAWCKQKGKKTLHTNFAWQEKETRTRAEVKASPWPRPCWVLCLLLDRTLLPSLKVSQPTTVHATPHHPAYLKDASLTNSFGFRNSLKWMRERLKPWGTGCWQGSKRRPNNCIRYRDMAGCPFGTPAYLFCRHEKSHLSKRLNELKHNGTKEKAPFSGTVFNTLSPGVIGFVASVSSKKHLLTGWNSLTANWRLLFNGLWS